MLPPIYKVKYNQFSETKNNLNNNEEESNLVCSKIAQKLFNPSTNNFSNIPRNKSKNSFMTQLNIKDNNENNENNDNKNNEDEQKFEQSKIIDNGLKIEKEEKENNKNEAESNNDKIEINNNNNIKDLKDYIEK